MVEDFEHDQEEDTNVESTKNRIGAPSGVAKSLPSDGSFKENPYIYLFEDNPALLACLCDTFLSFFSCSLSDSISVKIFISVLNFPHTTSLCATRKVKLRALFTFLTISSNPLLSTTVSNACGLLPRVQRCLQSRRVAKVLKPSSGSLQRDFL